MCACVKFSLRASISSLARSADTDFHLLSFQTDKVIKHLKRGLSVSFFRLELCAKMTPGIRMRLPPPFLPPPGPGPVQAQRSGDLEQPCSWTLMKVNKGALTESKFCPTVGQCPVEQPDNSVYIINHVGKISLQQVNTSHSSAREN